MDLAIERVDALILTALLDELNAIFAITGDNQTWNEHRDSKGFSLYTRSFDNGRGGTFVVAAAWIGEMGNRAAARRAEQLISEFDPGCVAVCGICGGDRKRVALGDVIIAEQLYVHDEGKVIAEAGKPRELHRQLRTLDLSLEWKSHAARFASQFDRTTLAQSRPQTIGVQRYWLLSTLLAQDTEGGTPPQQHPERREKCPDWQPVLREAQKAELITLSSGRLSLTDKGREEILNEQVFYPDGPPHDRPFQIRVGAIATGAAVHVDPELFDRLRPSMRNTLGVDMEAAIIAEAAEQSNRKCIVIKAVSDYADFDKGDSFRAFACRASAEVLLAFLCRHLEPHAGSSEGLILTTTTQAPDVTENAASLLRNWLNANDATRHVVTQQKLDRLLKDAPGELILKWAESLESLPMNAHVTKFLFTAMWREARTLNLVPYVAALDGRVDLKELTRFYLEKRAFWYPLKAEPYKPIGPGVRACEARFGWQSEAWEAHHSCAGLLFELVWDVLCNQYPDATDIEVSGVRWWDVLERASGDASAVTLGWPVQEFISFKWYEQFSEAWTDAYTHAIRLHVLAPYDDTILDDLAYWLIDVHHRTWHTNHFSFGDKWDVLRHLVESTDTKNLPFVRALPLLAAPESGLSLARAAAILADAPLDANSRAALHDLRLQRAHACLPKEDPERIIATIDAGHPEHPWVKVM